MRKKAIALYEHDEDRAFILNKIAKLPWLSCQAHPLSKAKHRQDCHILLCRTEDLPSLLSLKRVVGSYRDIPLLVFSPISQFPVLKMMDTSSCRIVQESIDSQSLADVVLSLLSSKCTQGKEEPSYRLTLREKQVIALILSGEENKEIASKMGIKLSTVYAHKKNLFLKTGMHTTSQLVVWALLREFAP